jgi:DNA-binding transcriptional LysR family regulator
MTIIQLKYFLTVCEFGKVRIASERLHVSEPTISISIKRLEKEIGAQLFVRDKKQLFLTDEGRHLLEKAADVVESFDRLELEMRQSQEKKTVIRLGAPSTLGEFLCSRLISEFTNKYPSVLFDIPPTSSVDGARQVEDGKIELAICDRLAVTSKQLVFSPIRRLVLYGFVRNDHPLAGKNNVSPRMLKDEKLILLSEKAITSREILRWFHDGGVNPNLFMYSNRISFSVSLIKRYNAVAFIYGGLLVDDAPFPSGNISPFELDPALSFEIGIIRKKGVNLTKEAQRFFDFCSQCPSM